MSSFIKTDNKKKDILILRLGPKQGLRKHSLSAEKMYSINFTKINAKFCLSLYYNGANSYLFVDGTEIYKFKAKGSEIVINICAWEIFKKNFQQITWKKLNLNVIFLTLVLITMQLMLMIF